MVIITIAKAEIIYLISNENYLLNVFPVGLKTGFIVDLEEFIRDLKYELDKYLRRHRLVKMRG